MNAADFTGETEPALLSGAWLDVIPTLAALVVMAVLILALAVAVERIKHRRRPRRPRATYRPLGQDDEWIGQ